MACVYHMSKKHKLGVEEPTQRSKCPHNEWLGDKTVCLWVLFLDLLRNLCCGKQWRRQGLRLPTSHPTQTGLNSSQRRTNLIFIGSARGRHKGVNRSRRPSPKTMPFFGNLLACHAARNQKELKTRCNNAVPILSLGSLQLNVKLSAIIFSSEEVTQTHIQ